MIEKTVKTWKKAMKTKDFQKTVCVGSKRPSRTARWFHAFCKIKYVDGKLSITGVEGPMFNGNCHGSCGKIVDGLVGEIVKYSPGWNAKKLQKFVDIWNKWHLNNMRAGCEHQRAANWSENRIDPAELPDDRHTNRDERGILAMWVRPSEHPKGLLCKPCPVCGYEYGSEWQFEEVPNDVLMFLKGLPESKTKPAWV